MKTAELFFCAAVAAFSACAETQVLIVHEKVRVDEWRVTDDCRWAKKGTWLACGADLKGPHSIAAADGIVYVGDSRGDANGAILKYSPEGKFLGVLASVPARPEALAIRDGFLYVCSAFGPNANRRDCPYRVRSPLARMASSTSPTAEAAKSLCSTCRARSPCSRPPINLLRKRTAACCWTMTVTGC